MLERDSDCSGRSQSGQVLAVVVLYKVVPERCAAFQSLLEAAAHPEIPNGAVRVLLFDNSPGGRSPEALPRNVEYKLAVTNRGIASAYNYALEIAYRESCDWLLTVDQDTSLPTDFLARLREVVLRCQKDVRIAAIVPHLVWGSSILSPNFVGRFRNRAVPLDFQGIAEEELYAFNSAALLRVAAIRELGGFCEDFWLDQLDLWLHRQFHLAGKRTYVAPNIRVEHELSLLDYGGLSPERFANFLSAESAFYDQYRSVGDNLAHTAVLAFRCCKHLAAGTDPSLTRAIRAVLKQRIFSSRAERVAEWKSGVRNRATSHVTKEKL